MPVPQAQRRVNPLRQSSFRERMLSGGGPGGEARAAALKGATEARVFDDAAQAVEKITKLAVQIGLDSGELANKTAAREATNSAEMEIREYMLGEKGVFSLRGKDATEAFKKVNGFIAKTRNTYIDGLGGDLAKSLFGATYDARAVDLLSRVLKFQEEQKREWEHKTLIDDNKTEVFGLVDYVGTHRDGSYNQGEVNDKIGRIAANTRALYADANPVVREKAVAKAINDAHLAVYFSELKASPAFALQYFKQNKTGILLEKRVVIEKEVRKLADAEIVDDLADMLSNTRQPLKTQIDLARKEPLSAENESKLVKELRLRHQDQENDREERWRQLYNTEFLKMTKMENPSDYEKPKGLPVEVQEKLDKTRRILINFANNVKEPPSDPQILSDEMNAAAEDPGNTQSVVRVIENKGKKLESKHQTAILKTHASGKKRTPMQSRDQYSANRVKGIGWGKEEARIVRGVFERETNLVPESKWDLLLFDTIFAQIRKSMDWKEQGILQFDITYAEAIARGIEIEQPDEGPPEDIPDAKWKKIEDIDTGKFRYGWVFTDREGRRCMRLFTTMETFELNARGVYSPGKF